MSTSTPISCRTCGEANLSSNRYCARCGGSLAVPSENPFATTYLPPAQPHLEPLTAQTVDDPNFILREQRRQALEKTARIGINWFFWIAGASLVNTVIHLSGGQITFIIGLGATQIVDIFADILTKRFGPAMRGIGIGIDLVLAGIFAGAAMLGRRGHRWIVVLAMLLYVGDALIFVWLEEIGAVLLHLFALAGLWSGLNALNKLKSMERTGIIPP